MKKAKFILLLVILFSLSNIASALDFTGEVIYQIMIDRFYDGNVNNNNPAKAPGLYDANKSNWKLYWGGDLEGITQKLSYLAELGVTALWITPIHDNMDVAVHYSGTPNAGYHGYWARDFKKVDEHFGTWVDFDDLVDEAQNYGIKVLLDYAPNHTSPTDTNDPNFGERGALYYNGQFMGDYLNDYNGYFHLNGGITNWDDRFETQFKNLADLGDLAQEHPTIDSYLKEAAIDVLNRGIAGFRIDAIKHMTLGWQLSLVDSIFAEKDVYMTGEWYLGGYTDPLYSDNVKFANRTGISPLDFYLNKAIVDVFAYNQSFTVLNNAVAKVGADYKFPNNLTNFVDNHDMARFLTRNNNYSRLHQALAFIMTGRGIPIIYYGTEQYLHDDTNGGGDPWNRPMMVNWDTTTEAFKLIQTLSSLRQSQPAIRYGLMYERWINNNVYIFERKFYDSTVLVAINKSSSSAYISNLYTALPTGQYTDYLAGRYNGNTITVNSSGQVNNFYLAGNSIAVWSYIGNHTTPQIGSIGPVLGRVGNEITIGGKGFGTSGTVRFGTTSAQVISWTDSEIKVVVPTVTPGFVNVTVSNSNGVSNGIEFEVLTAKLIPVFFKVTNANTAWGEQVYLTGNVHELGSWSTNTERTYGPLVCPNYPEWFTVAAVPAGTTIQFKFIKINSSGTVTWEGGQNHTYTVPSSGTGSVTVNWQN